MSPTFAPGPSSNYISWTMFVSGLIWIPFALILLWLYYEHHSRNRYPQYLVAFLFFVSATCRCIWFFLYSMYYTSLFAIFINRVAILCQFSAISYLVVMWLRSVSISLEVTDRAGVRLSRFRDPAVVRYFNRILLGVNVCAWGITIGSVFSKSDYWYVVNLVSLATVCFLEACISLVIGLRTAYVLRHALQENVPQDVNKNSSWYFNVPVLSSFVGLSICLKDMFDIVFSSKRDKLFLQRKVVRGLLSVSLLMTVFFLIRSLAFLAQPIFVDLGNQANIGWQISDALYPFFFYQLPELIPTLAISYGISPPNSVIRRNWFSLCYRSRVMSKIFFPSSSATSNSKGDEIPPSINPSFSLDNVSPSFSVSVDGYNPYNPNYFNPSFSSSSSSSSTSSHMSSEIKNPLSNSATENRSLSGGVDEEKGMKSYFMSNRATSSGSGSGNSHPSSIDVGSHSFVKSNSSVNISNQQRIPSQHYSSPRTLSTSHPVSSSSSRLSCQPLQIASGGVGDSCLLQETRDEDRINDEIYDMMSFSPSIR